MSTGPKDTSVTKFNSLKHGLLSKEVLLKGEDKHELAQLQSVLIEGLSPVGSIEQILVERIVSSIWRLKRALKVERKTMEWEYTKEIESEFNRSYISEEQIPRQGYRDMIAGTSGDYVLKILRYETTIERQIYKALHELLRVQSARKGEKPPLPIALDVDISNDT